MEIKYKGKTIEVEQPFLHYDTCLGEHYRAYGEDEDGCDYLVMWDIINRNCEDESDACDWDEYTVKKY